MTAFSRSARRIAALAEAESIGEDHLFEALQYRSLDRAVWMQGRNATGGHDPRSAASPNNAGMWSKLGQMPR
ncbi:MAG: hypothetical protein ACOYOL_10680 [Chthoniobacterales bacterium]